MRTDGIKISSRKFWLARTKDVSATMEAMSPEKVNEIKAQGGFQKFEIVDFSDSDGKKIALRDDYFDRFDMQKKVPNDGQNLSVEQLLNNYKTPFGEAYEHSKQLKDGEPGKSKTLEEVIDRLKDCPWVDKINIQFDSKAPNTEYDNFACEQNNQPEQAPCLTESTIQVFTNGIK